MRHCAFTSQVRQTIPFRRIRNNKPVHDHSFALKQQSARERVPTALIPTKEMLKFWHLSKVGLCNRAPVSPTVNPSSLEIACAVSRSGFRRFSLPPVSDVMSKAKSTRRTAPAHEYQTPEQQYRRRRVRFSVHRRSTFTNVRQFVEHRGQLGNGIAG